MSSQSRGFLASPEGLKLLQAAKAERGWTFAAIAQRAGVSADTVSRLFHPERGKRVSGVSVSAIAEVLGVEVEAIGLVEAAQDPLAEAERRIQKALESGATNLTFSSLGLKALPERLSQLAKLTGLDLSRNRLMAIPDSLGNLANLMELDLSQNELTTLPESFTKLTNLTALFLSYNQLTALPNSLEKLTNLTALDLSYNQLTVLPNSLEKLTNLTELELCHNQLTTLPESLGKLTNLTRAISFSRKPKGASVSG